jgi:hypothetical protein
MSDTPTPETDAHLLGGSYSFDGDFARKLERERDEARAEAAKWKANHDNQVALKSAIIQRPDLGDRSERVHALIKNRDFLRAEIESMRDDIKSALTLIEKMRIILINSR